MKKSVIIIICTALFACSQGNKSMGDTKQASAENCCLKDTLVFNNADFYTAEGTFNVEAGKDAKEQLVVASNDYYIAANNDYFSVPLQRDDKYTTEGNGFYVNSDGRNYTNQFDRGLLGTVIGENHPKNGNVHYLPPKSVGSYASVLVAMFSPDIQLEKPAMRKRAEQLAKVHEKIELSPVELLQITNWIDTNCQYYGTYYGRRDTMFINHPDYRTEYDVITAISPSPPISYE